MVIIYGDDRSFGSYPPRNMSRMDATKQWTIHFNNSLFLTAVQQSPKDFSERHQATKELAICERKMAFWRRHPNFEQQKAADEALKLKKMWEYPDRRYREQISDSL